MNIAVIGGSGYIGSALSRRLAAGGHRVVVVDPVMPPERCLCRPVRFEDSNIELNRFHAVYHLADIAGIQKCEELGQDEVRRRNVLLTKAVVDGLKKSPDTSLIYTSTSAIYAGTSLYSISKLMSEYFVATHSNSVSLRLGTVYGISPKMRTGILVHDMVEQAVSTGELDLWHGNTARPFLHIDSCVDCLVELANTTLGGFENIYSDHWTKERIAKIIQSFTGCKINFAHAPNRFFQDFIMGGSGSLGRYSIENDIEEIVRYYASRL